MADNVSSVIYNGRHFRDKLTAHWAVFFDAIRLKYTHPTEGIDLDGIPYTPDFWLPHSVLGLAADGWGFWGVCAPFLMEEEALNKVVALVAKTRHNALIFEGFPWENEYGIIKISGVHQDVPVIQTGFRFVEDQELSLIMLKGPHGSSFPNVPIPRLNHAYLLAQQTRFD